MWLRVLLAAILLVTAGLIGCKKEEPTPAQPAESTQQVQQETSPVTEENLDSKADEMEQETQEDIAAEE